MVINVIEALVGWGLIHMKSQRQKIHSVVAPVSTIHRSQNPHLASRGNGQQRFFEVERGVQ